MTDLDKLIDAVEGGCIDTTLIIDAIDEPRDQVVTLAAFDGSLDAAKALHEALLPGFDYSIDKENGGYSVHIWKDLEAVSISSSEQSDSRAWLIAILKAYRSLQ